MFLQLLKCTLRNTYLQAVQAVLYSIIVHAALPGGFQQASATQSSCPHCTHIGAKLPDHYARYLSHNADVLTYF